MTHAKSLLENQDIIVEELFLYDMELPRVEALLMEAWDEVRAFVPLDDNQQKEYDKQQKLLNQWKEADGYVISMPLHNFNVTSRLKDYFDNVLIAGETFRYTETGSEGLLPAGRKALFIQASGSIFSQGPNRENDFAPQYVNNIFQFVGVQDCFLVRAEGTAIPTLDQEKILEDAKQEISTVLKGLVNNQ